MEKNRKAWDEVVPIHSSHRTGEAQFFKNGGITLDKIELGILPELMGKKLHIYAAIVVRISYRLRILEQSVWDLIFQNLQSNRQSTY